MAASLPCALAATASGQWFDPSANDSHVWRLLALKLPAGSHRLEMTPRP